MVLRQTMVGLMCVQGVELFFGLMDNLVFRSRLSDQKDTRLRPTEQNCERSSLHLDCAIGPERAFLAS
jgi:hypothetical protein